MSDKYDLVIIGAGSGGLSAASFAVQLGARIALVEKNRVGGDCTWTGCVPSKTLLKTAKVAREMRTADLYGLSSAHPQVDIRKIMAHVRDDGDIPQIGLSHSLPHEKEPGRGWPSLGAPKRDSIGNYSAHPAPWQGPFVRCLPPTCAIIRPPWHPAGEAAH